jgi:superfamily I DNA/RNA helicase
VNDAAPRDIRDHAGHFLVRLPARLVPVEEQDGDVPATALVADLRRRATAHKAKGLEWPRVRLGADFPGLGELQP